MSMDVDGACLSGPKSKGKMKGNRDCSAERRGQNKTIQDKSDEHAQVFAWQFQSL